MRKIYLLGISLLIFLLSFSFAFVKISKAESSMASPASELNEKIDYQLPYPGLLPDSPLYFLRIIRDKSVGLLISDPLKKAEFDLLQADKRLNAGIYLFNKGKTSLALSTISKAENYFNEALNKMEQAKAQGERVNEIKGNLQNALEKHEQELEYLTAKVGRDFKVSFEKERKRLTDFEERLSR